MRPTEFKVTRPSGFLSRLSWRLRRWTDWGITFNQSSLTLLIGKQKEEISYLSFKNLKIRDNSKLVLELDNAESISLPCPRNTVSPSDLNEAFREALQNYIESFLARINLPDKSPYDFDGYVSCYSFTVWMDSLSYMQQLNKILDLHDRLNFKHPEQAKEKFRQLDLWRKYHAIIQNKDTWRKEHNEKFIAAELERNQDFFDNVESKPLTQEQRRAAIEMEDRNLLVAAAGSGKTSVMIGKVGYSLEADFCQPNEILVLAFNKKAVEELEERLVRQLGEKAEQITVSTFHKFGLDTIGKAQGRKPSVASWTTNLGESSASNNYWEGLISQLLASNADFEYHYFQLRLCFSYDMKPQHQFKSQNDYEVYLESIGAKSGKGGAQGNEYWGAETIQGERVKSLQELTIANWLYSRNVKYEYEAQYEHETATSKHRSYMPDFYYPDAQIYHEHFALDKNGKPPSYFKNYLEEVEWKRKQHRDSGTKLIETTSYMFSQGTVFEHLHTELEKHGIECSGQRSSLEIKTALAGQTVTPIHELIQQFLQQWKSSGLSIQELFQKADRLSGYAKLRAYTFLRIADILRKAYEAKLRENNEIDFESMISQAADCLDEKTFQHSYKLVLVDEFQDISRSRAKLIKALLRQKPDCTLFAVGDDWQSIYRFAGSNINIMTNFQEEFGVTARNDLTMTFRSNKGITDIATKFISTNPSQLSKDVTAIDDTTESVINLVQYSSPEAVEPFIQQQLEDISAKGESANVFILSRYNFQRPESINEWRKQFNNLLDIKFSTVHSVKGKEADYVFVVGMEIGRLGFPPNRAEDSLLDLVQPEAAEKYKFAEERRLFYVAVTRAKQKVFLLGPHARTSPFLDEIMAHENISNGKIIKKHYLDKKGMPASPPTNTKPYPCPECGARMVERKSRYGKFLGCLNYPKCEGTRKLAAPPRKYT